MGVLSYASWVSYANFAGGAFDLGVNVQAVGTAGTGVVVDRSDYMLYGGALGSNYLGVHFSPIFYLLYPLGQLFSPVVLLFVLQWLALGLGAPLIYAIATDARLSKRLALGLAVVYLVYPPTLISGSYDFHLMAFVPAIELLLYLALRRRRLGIALAALVLAAITEEAALLLAVFVALQAVLDASPSLREAINPLRWDAHRWRIAGLAAAAAVGFGLAVLIERAIAPLRPNEVFVNVGSSLAASNLLTHLQFKLGYWLVLLAFAGFLPLVGIRRALPILPSAALTFLSSNLNFSMLEWQYSFLAVPGLFIASIEGTRWWARRWEAIGSDLPRSNAPPPAGRVGALIRHRWRVPPRTTVAFAAFAALLLAEGVFSPMTPISSQLPNSRCFPALVPPANWSQVASIGASIPRQATVVASEYLFAYVADNPNAYPLLVYGQSGGSLGPLGHLPPGVRPDYFVVFSTDVVWGHVLYAGFPSNYTLVKVVHASAAFPLDETGGAPPGPWTIELFRWTG